MEMLERLHTIGDAVVQAKVSKAMHVIERSVALYGLDGMAFSFNGGKDSTVLLHLIRVVLVQQGTSLDGPGQGLGGIRSFYFNTADDFEEVQQFVRDADRQYSLAVEYLQHPDFKAGLCEYLSTTGVRAILLGTRRGDPNAGDQAEFCPSSSGWPAFMRINPVLDWTYHDVWAALHALGAPYCCLYDRGYTSLGARHNTLPNSVLRKEDGSYAPAHLLLDGRLERAGRQRPGGLEGHGSGFVARAEGSCRAGVVVVGDEILSGKVQEVNAGFLCRELRAIGWRVCKVVVVADDVDAIGAEVGALSACMDAVVTSGGVGPTLDDVTMEGVARALGETLVRNPELEERLRAYFGRDVTEAHLKMAETPAGTDTQLVDYPLADGSPSPFPLVMCRNIFVLPGVPHLLRQKWGAVRARLQAAVEAPPFFNRVLRLREVDEARLAPALQDLAAEACPTVAIGSYPVTEQKDGALVMVTLEGRDQAAVAAAAERLVELLPAGCLLLGQHEDVAHLPASRSATPSSNSGDEGRGAPGGGGGAGGGEGAAPHAATGAQGAATPAAPAVHAATVRLGAGGGAENPQ